MRACNRRTPNPADRGLLNWVTDIKRASSPRKRARRAKFRGTAKREPGGVRPKTLDSRLRGNDEIRDPSVTHYLNAQTLPFCPHADRSGRRKCQSVLFWYA